MVAGLGYVRVFSKNHAVGFGEPGREDRLRAQECWAGLPGLRPDSASTITLLS